MDDAGLEFLMDPIDRLGLGSAPSDRTPCTLKMHLLEQSICKYAEEPGKSFFGSVEKVLFTKRTLRNICGQISHEQTDYDMRKTLEVFADIVGSDPDFLSIARAGYTTEVEKMNKYVTMHNNAAEREKCSRVVMRHSTLYMQALDVVRMGDASAEMFEHMSAGLKALMANASTEAFEHMLTGL
ncbi:hypothetical protein VPH35_015314 [Triticum aestivum]